MSTFTIQINCAAAPVTRYVDLYSSWGQTSNYNYDLYYKIDNGSDVYWGTINTTICGNLDTVGVPNGSTLYVYAVNASNANQVKIRGSASGTCPANLDVTCVYSTVITANGSVAITVYVDNNGDPAYCT
jgi:hypothetical protein